MTNKCYRITLGGISIALCTLCLLMAAIVPSFSMLLPMMSGMLIGAVTIETDIKWAMLTFFAASLVGLFVCPDFGVMLVFLLFFGYYPILHVLISKLHTKILRAVCKCAVFNFAFWMWFSIMRSIVPAFLTLDKYENVQNIALSIIAVVANIFFLSYNVIIKEAQEYYVKIFRKKFLCLPAITSS